nr:DUF4214 domain-containing protein [Salipiger sp. PrR002]
MISEALGYQAQATATFTIVDDDGRFAPTGAAAVSGNGWQDQLLNADTSTIEDADGLGAFSYQWLRDGNAIASATSASYTTTDDDIGAAISVRVSYTDGAGELEVLTSAPLQIVDADDILVGTAAAETLNGNDGDDVLIGGDVEDVSTETGAQVYRLYQATLGRVPDTAGFDNWSARLESGSVSLLEVISGFVKSAEFQNTYGDLGNRGFVTLLYNNVLDRAPDASGLNNWAARLDSGTSREQVVRGFSESAEFMAKTNPEAFSYVEAGDAAPWADDVYRLYQATLDRAPDITGLLNWAGRLGEGSNFLSVTTGFVNSQEFQTTYGAVGNPGFVKLLYNNVLDRDPDSAGLSNWTARLDNGMSREQVVQGFAQSAEFIDKTTPAFHAFMASNEGDWFDGGPGNDLLYGGLRADTFVFDQADKGSDRVLQLDAWDSVAFNGFGYANAAAAVTHMREAGDDVVFSDQGVAVTFMRADLALFDEVSVLV